MHDRLVQFMNAGERVLLVSPPGMGKTARIAQAAKAANYRLITRRISLCERIDFGGCLVPDTAAGITRALPLELLNELRTTKTPTVFFADDLGQAPVDVQAALMLLFDEGELSENVLIWGATNRPGDKAGVTALCEPLRSRFSLAFAIATPGASAATATAADAKKPKYLADAEAASGASVLQPWFDPSDGPSEVGSWCEWALANEADPAIVAWHRSTAGRTLYAWKPHADPAMRLPDFRSWATVVRLFKSGIRDVNTLGAAIGKGAAAEFTAYAALADNLPTPEEVFMDPKGAKVPDATDASGLYLIATMLGAAVDTKFAGPFCDYIDRMPRVFAALAGKDAFRRIGAKITSNPSWCRWWQKNSELFSSPSR